MPYQYLSILVSDAPVSKDVTDTASLTLTDSATADVTTSFAGLPLLFYQAVGSDSTNVDVTDTSSLTLTEAAELAITADLAVEDTASLTLTDAGEMSGQSDLAVSDTASLTATDASALEIEAAVSVTDTASLSVTDSGAIESADEKSASDDAALTLTDTAAVEQIDATVEDERPAGGWGYLNDAAAQRQRDRARRQREQWDAEKEAELAQLLQAKLAAEESAAPAVSDETRELQRIRALVAEYASGAQSEFLTRRGQRAVEYAMKARTDLAYMLAAREIERFEEDAIAAVLLLALDD